MASSTPPPPCWTILPILRSNAENPMRPTYWVSSTSIVMVMSSPIIPAMVVTPKS
jgi:hypothetical protein